ncbi:MAG: clan AA aspartic protease [Thermoanaerobaculia bacterium]
MIVGRVNSDREAVVSLVVQGSQGQARQVEAVIDTGFTGLLTLPPDLIAELDLPLRAQGRAVLGDGREITFDMFKANVIWDGRACRIDVDAADTVPLVGMGLLESQELCIQVVHGGSVAIRALPVS